MRKFYFKTMIMALLIAVLFSLRGFGQNAMKVESIYTKGVYLKIKYGLGLIASKMSFPYGEVIVGIFLLLGIGLLSYRFYRAIAYLRVQEYKTLGQVLVKDLYRGAVVLLILLIGFQTLWGLNYYSDPLMTKLHLDNKQVDSSELAQLLEDELIILTDLREHLDKNDNQVVTTALTVDDLMRQALIDYQLASEVYEFIDQPTSQPKPIISSLFFSYSGISGIYNPFTGEANVNHLNSSYLLPVVALHEMAHQQGIAREDEANFIAYVVATNSPSDFTQYSGRLLILIHGLNNLRSIDPETHYRLYDSMPQGIKNDLRAHRELWAAYEGRLDELQDSMNDQYLKANGQESGIASYSEVINLYIAWQQKKL